ncbi:MAG TPA: sulfite exporter TauE/SafE family protein [Actinomycetota bacterium]|jgi:uncharacterized membrane protein YfcA|nr:sulfite exporter TauE/SafE family protein [Actinomycetota bacterium]
MTGLEIGLTVVAGVLTGILSALFGGGGGQISIPFMILVLGFSQHVAEGTSLFVIVPTAAVGAWAHSRRGYVRWRSALWLGIAGLAGAAAGSLLAIQTDELVLRRIYAAFVLYAAFRFLRPARPAPRPVERATIAHQTMTEERDGPGD